MGTKDVTLLPMGYLTDRASIFSHTVAPMRAEAGPPARTKVRPSDNCEDFFLLPKLEKHFYKKNKSSVNQSLVCIMERWVTTATFPDSWTAYLSS